MIGKQRGKGGSFFFSSFVLLVVNSKDWNVCGFRKRERERERKERERKDIERERTEAKRRGRSGRGKREGERGQK